MAKHRRLFRWNAHLALAGIGYSDLQINQNFFASRRRPDSKLPVHNFRLRPVDTPIGRIAGEPKGATCSF
jgi:hypothetical protein